ncbi:type IV secretory pathway TrbL component [Bradyrhizobium sp. USDA 3240]
MTINAAILMAALVLSGTVLAQSSGPSAGSAGAGQAANVTTGQAINTGKQTGDSGPPIAKAAHPAKPAESADGSTVGASRPKKPDRRLEHYP